MRFELPRKRTSWKDDFADVYLSMSSEFPGVLGIYVIRLLPISSIFQVLQILVLSIYQNLSLFYLFFVKLTNGNYLFKWLLYCINLQLIFFFYISNTCSIFNQDQLNSYHDSTCSSTFCVYRFYYRIIISLHNSSLLKNSSNNFMYYYTMEKKTVNALLYSPTCNLSFMSSLISMLFPSIIPYRNDDEIGSKTKYCFY